MKKKDSDRLKFARRECIRSSILLRFFKYDDAKTTTQTQPELSNLRETPSYKNRLRASVSPREVSSFEQGIHEFFGIEGQQISDLLADAYEAHRQAKFA